MPRSEMIRRATIGAILAIAACAPLAPAPAPVDLWTDHDWHQMHLDLRPLPDFGRCVTYSDGIDTAEVCFD